jgi:hypothetical protein
MQIDGELLPNSFTLELHRRLENLVLNIWRQAAPALHEPVTPDDKTSLGSIAPEVPDVASSLFFSCDIIVSTFASITE